MTDRNLTPHAEARLAMTSFPALHIQFATGDDGSVTIRKWSQFPFEGSEEYRADPAPQTHLRGLPDGFTRKEIEDMLSIVQDEPQTIDGGGEFGPQESTDGWYTRLLREILKNAEDAP